MDETPICFEMTGKTKVEKIGIKQLMLKRFELKGLDYHYYWL